MYFSKPTVTWGGLSIAQFIRHSSCIAVQLFSDPSISIPEAPSSHQFSLSSHPQPDVLNSPVRRRFHHFRSGKGFEAVNTLFSGVYPSLNLTWLGHKPQDLVVLIDTGSSDTWVVSSEFQCLDINTKVPRPQETCAFGKPYDSALGSFTNITSQKFSISYFPESQTLNGSMGYAPLRLGGLTVPNQEVALVTEAALIGDGFSSGLIGLGYPAITAASYRSNGSQAVYNPVFTTMVKEGIVKNAVFTLALDRVPRGTSSSVPAGMMAFGGLVSPRYYLPPFTTVPIEETPGIPGLSFYTMSLELIYDRKNGTTASGGTYQSIIDSGTAPNFVASAAAADINDQFSPSAVYNKTLGYWTVDCNAKAPFAAFKIGGKVMPMNPKDMIVRSLNGLPGFEDVCFSSFADGGDSVFIVGEVWQRSYVVAYDIGRSQLHFANRAPY
ncbi:aspartic peptidase domain-containing protein [Tricladium varicosporioides]|nr:aspartic peptidase domain-containing protein [Hymenoscyphus varicosporioides]